jgi:hypothetical protein
VIAVDAIDVDRHHLIVLVDCNGNFGLRAAGGEHHETGDSNNKTTHVTSTSKATYFKATHFKPTHLEPTH